MTTDRSLPQIGAFAPPTVREMLLGAVSGLLVAAVADDDVVVYVAGIASLALACAATWMAYKADEERKQRLSAAEQMREWDDDQW